MNDMTKRFVRRQSWGVFGIVMLAVMVMSWLIAAASPATPATSPQGTGLSLSLQSFATGLSQPVSLTNAGDSRLFAVEQEGYIRIIQSNGTVLGTAFLNITDRVNSAGSEQGLLGLAFHPDYATNGFFYVNYTSNDSRTRISRFQVTGNPNVADPNSEEILLTVTQPYSNHNAGDIHFGPDGYLYVPLGDGGSGGDPQNNAQTMTTLLGKITRIDVDNGPGAAADCKGAGTGNYTIPNDNPFINGTGSQCDEIWALGLRNPWRSSFDLWTGDLWIGDVGQNAWEEIDFQPVYSDGGENYGWRCYEGNHTYNTSGCGPIGNYVFPVTEYDHNSGRCSVSGGYVYRGSQYPAMFGHYLLTDYCSGHFWDVAPDGQGGWVTTQHNNLTAFGRSAFGENSAGELFVANRSQGTVERVADATANSPSLFVTLDGPATYETGDPVVYTLTITNTGNAAATNLTVRNWLPTGATYVSGGTYSAGVVSWNIANLAAGNSTSVQYTVNGNQTLFNNRFGVTSNEVSANGSGAVETVFLVPVLGISKSGPTSANPGDLITYTLTIINSGTALANNLVISDTVPVGASYISGGNYSGGVVTWNAATLAAQGQLQVQFVVTATQTIINDTFSVTADEASATGTSSVTTTILNPADSIYLPLIRRD